MRKRERGTRRRARRPSAWAWAWRSAPRFRVQGDRGALGRKLLYESGDDPWRLMLRARLPVIALTLLFGLVVFAFTR